MTTKVIFKKFPEGDVIALFPDLPGTNNPYKDCLSYCRIGQHSSASLDLSGLKPAKESEYKDLYNELVSIGYDDLEIVRKFSKNSLKNRIAQIKGDE